MESVRCYIKAVSSPFELPSETKYGPVSPPQARRTEPYREEVMLMGKKRWNVVLRWIVSFLVTLGIMLLFSPKAC